MTEATETFLTAEQLAARWQMKEATLGNWRVNKTGPSYLKIGAGRNTKVLYCLADVIEYENRKVIKIESK